MSSFTHAHVVLNLNSSVQHKTRYYEECFNCCCLYDESQGDPKQHQTPFAFIVWRKKDIFSKYYKEKGSNRFGMT